MAPAFFFLLLVALAEARSWESIVSDNLEKKFGKRSLFGRSGIEEKIEADVPEKKPYFKTIGETIRVKTKDTIVLPCEVENVGHYMQAWKRGIAILTAGSVKVTPDERFRLIDGYNLEIRDVQTQDAGDYVCQIATLQPKEITHRLEIMVPPRIHSVSSGGSVEVKKGATVTLECKASGNPVPTVTWSRKNNMLPTGGKYAEGYSITIQDANRHHAGIYMCTASSIAGDPVTREIHFNVLYAPEIEVERSWVHSGEGYEAQLVCLVHAEPPAEVVWFRDTLRLDTTERRIMEVRGARHTLIIRKVQSSDFGNYSCLADNTMGKTRQFLELSGKPNPAVFKSHTVGRSKDSYNITWTVNSYTPIEEFKLSFRKVPVPSPPDSHHEVAASQSKRNSRRENETGYPGIHRGGGDWNDVILPAMPSEQYTQSMFYLIKNLEPATQYEARVQAKNRFGWNVMSENFVFTTKGAGGYEPSSQPAVLSADQDIRDLGVRSLNGCTKTTSTSILIAILAIFELIRI